MAGLRGSIADPLLEAVMPACNGVEPEMTARISDRGDRVYEVPMTYGDRGHEDGKTIAWRDGFVALWVLLKYRFTE